MFGQITTNNGWWSGVLHPVRDLEHVATMLLVGVLAGLGTVTGRSAWRASLGFLGGMVVGSVLGVAGVPTPGLGWVLVALVVVLVGLLFVSARVAPVLPTVAVAVGLLHGVSHGSAVTVAGHAWGFVAGSLFTAAVAIGCGTVIGLSVARPGLEPPTEVPMAPVASRRAA